MDVMPIAPGANPSLKVFLRPAAAGAGFAPREERFGRPGERDDHFVSPSLKQRRLHRPATAAFDQPVGYLPRLEVSGPLPPVVARIFGPYPDHALAVEGRGRHTEPGQHLDLRTAGQQVQIGGALAHVEAVGPVRAPPGRLDLDPGAVGYQVVMDFWVKAMQANYALVNAYESKTLAALVNQ